MLPASQITPQHIKLGADPNQSPDLGQAASAPDAATMHQGLASSHWQQANEAVDGGGLARSIRSQQANTLAYKSSPSVSMKRIVNMLSSKERLGVVSFLVENRVLLYNAALLCQKWMALGLLQHMKVMVHLSAPSRF